MMILSYFAITLSVLLALTMMILSIGKRLSACPQNGPAIAAAAITIATGYAAIGAGMVTITATALPMSQNAPEMLLFSVGFACLILGLGFSHAATTLRAVIQGVAPRNAPPEPVLPRTDES